MADIPMWGVQIGSEAASAYADLTSISIDFNSAAEAFDSVAQGLDDGVLVQGMWAAGAISYRRAFTSGKSLIGARRSRLRLPGALINALTPEFRELHERLMEEANQHFAHRVSGLEQMNVNLVLNNPRVGKKVVGIAPFWIRFVAPGKDTAAKAVELATWMREQVGAQRDSLGERIIASAQELDPDFFYANAVPLGPEPETQGEGPEEPSP